MLNKLDEKFLVTTLFEPKDKLDRNIVNKTVSMIVGLQLETILKDKQTHDLHFDYVKEIAESLFKANSHRRKYIIQKEKSITEFKEKCIKNSGNTDRAMHSPDLISEIDGVLTHIKAALDSLAKTFYPVLGVKLHGWHKVKQESGRQVVNALENNVESGLKEKIQPLKEFIENNIPWISYLVDLRDGPNHKGGLKNITDIVYRQDRKEIIPIYILHKNSPEEMSIFLTRTVEEITDFIHSVLVHSLSAQVSPQMFIVKNKEETFPPYHWAITVA